MTRSKVPEKDQLKITAQYRSKSGRVYELTHGELSLAVHITPRRCPEDRGDWCVQTNLGIGIGPSLVDGWGATPGDALREVASTWSASSPERQALDWEAVTRALHAVRGV